MKSISAGFSDDVDHGAWGSSSFGCVAIGLNGNFLDGVNRGLHANGSDDPLIIVGTVNQLVIEHVIMPVHGEGAALATIIRTLAAAQPAYAGSFIRAWRKLDQVGKVARLERNLLHMIGGYG